MPRLFVAIDIPERIKDDISSTYMAIPGTRWVDDAQLHITLRFIGEVDNNITEKITHSLNATIIPPFNLILKGVGHFPPRKIPRILWVGISDNPELIRLQNKIENSIISTGIQPDTRKFHPHITIARLNAAPEEKIAMFLSANSLFKTEPFEVSQFHLYSSHLKKDGAYHEILQSYRLQ
ncbi:MAG TPA: RNA 2',3'-cyclic phosphodiesterase [Chitinispirillaceae bacterium]|nr:RNA 2',3'-cyclic phosphodiesterase [Chitinispirillaceae bacterium]